MSKYMMRTFCEPCDLLLEKEKKQLEREGHYPGEVRDTYFADKDELYYHIIRAEIYRNIRLDVGVQNPILDAIMTNPRDSLRRVVYLSHIYGLFIHEGYMIMDDKNRVIDLRNYRDELDWFRRVRFSEYARKREQELRAKRAARYEAREAYWERYKRLTDNKDYYGYYRSIHTTPERRAAANPEHQPYIRGRRSLRNIPNSYDDIGICREKTWKARAKVRKQYMTSQPKHADTELKGRQRVERDQHEEFLDEVHESYMEERRRYSSEMPDWTLEKYENCFDADDSGFLYLNGEDEDE
jgi:hypothetical protein